jgi:hypothetical protein
VYADNDRFSAIAVFRRLSEQAGRVDKRKTQDPPSVFTCDGCCFDLACYGGSFGGTSIFPEPYLDTEDVRAMAA